METEQTKKKTKISKKIIIPLMAILVLGIASAMIVNYLSNNSTANVEVKNAMEVAFSRISSDAFPLTRTSDWSSTLTIDETTQLSTILAGVQVKNNADVAIENKFLALTISNELHNVSCGDITSLMFLDTATQIQLDKGFQELVGLLSCNSDGEKIVYNIPINSLASKTTYEYPAKITFGAVQPTTYSFDAQMIISA